jgi:hypothetical protein
MLFLFLPLPPALSSFPLFPLGFSALANLSLYGRRRCMFPSLARFYSAVFRKTSGKKIIIYW